MLTLAYIGPGHGFDAGCDVAGVLALFIRACPWATLLAVLALALGAGVVALGHFLHDWELGGPVFACMKVPARR